MCSSPIRATSSSRSTRRRSSPSRSPSSLSASGRACASSPGATSSTASSRSSSSFRATATTAKCAERIGAYLAEVFDGHVSAFYPAFPEGSLARVHFIVGRAGGPTPDPSQATLEAAVEAIIRTWSDGLAAALAGTPRCGPCRPLGKRYGAAFPPAYRDDFPPETAVADIDGFERLTVGAPGRGRIPHHRGWRADRPPPYPPERPDRTLGTRPDAREHGLPGDRRTHLRDRAGGGTARVSGCTT